MSELLKTNGRRRMPAGKNGRGAALRGGDPSGNGGRANGSRSLGGAMLPGKTASLDQPRRLSALLVSLAREMFGVDDHVAELPLRQLRVCAILHQGPLSMSALSRELGVSLSAMTQIADRLERARLVKRSFEGTDRRVRCLQLTGRGQRMMRLREDARTHRASQVLRQLSAKEQSEVVRALEVLLHACSAAKP